MNLRCKHSEQNGLALWQRGPSLEVANEKVAVFKPESGEHFNRKGLHNGEGAIREEAGLRVFESKDLMKNAILFDFSHTENGGEKETTLLSRGPLP